MTKNIITRKQAETLHMLGYGTSIITHHLFRPKIEEIAKWFREVLGVDLVISPRFNSRTGDRIGYFWRWSQRTDVQDKKTFKTYERALYAGVSAVLTQFNGYDND